MSKIKSVSTYNGTQWNTPVPLGADDVNIDITSVTNPSSDSIGGIPGDSTTNLTTRATTIENGDTLADAFTKYNRFKARINDKLNNSLAQSNNNVWTYNNDSTNSKIYTVSNMNYYLQNIIGYSGASGETLPTQTILSQLKDKVPIINVKEHGVISSLTADNSSALATIVANMPEYSILYFPAGNYSFQDINITKSVTILGDGRNTRFLPRRKHANTDQRYTMFNINNGSSIIRNVNFYNVRFEPDASLGLAAKDQSPRSETVATIKAKLVDYLCMDHVWFDAYIMTAHANTPRWFENRQGLAIYFNSCYNIYINNCDFGKFGGDEFAQISQNYYYHNDTTGDPSLKDNTNNYGTGIVSITNSYFHDKQAGFNMGGSYFGIYGGKCIIFDNNTIINVRNIYPDAHMLYPNSTNGKEVLDGNGNLVNNNGGSLFNLLGSTVRFTNNTFKGCYAGNYVDFSEGFYNKVDHLLIANNQMHGRTAHPMRFMARVAIIENNIIESAQGIRAFTYGAANNFKHQSVIYPDFVPYHADDSTVYNFDTLRISNNTFLVYPLTAYQMLSDNSPGGDSSVLEINRPYIYSYSDTSTNPPTTIKDYTSAKAIWNLVDISNNVIRRSGTEIAYAMNTIWTVGKINKCFIRNNVFIGTGATSTASPMEYRAIMGGNATISGLDDSDSITNLIFKDNIISMDTAPYNNVLTFLVHGELGFKTHLNWSSFNNIGIGDKIRYAPKNVTFRSFSHTGDANITEST